MLCRQASPTPREVVSNADVTRDADSRCRGPSTRRQLRKRGNIHFEAMPSCRGKHGALAGRHPLLAPICDSCAAAVVRHEINARSLQIERRWQIATRPCTVFKYPPAELAEVA